VSYSRHKLLRSLVWKGGKWYVRRRYGRFVPSRRAVLGGLFGLLAIGVAVAFVRGTCRGRSAA
jgi:hypothetical protein